jgi:hypothetical protein
MSGGKPAFDVHPGVAWTRRWMAGLKEKTGRTESEWRALVRKSGPKDPKECRAWLMKEHGLGSRNAWYFSTDGEEMAWGGNDATYLAAAPKYVDAMYAGKKAALRPVFDALVKAGRTLGADVKIAPCQTMVPFYREFVFAEIHPTTQTRVDLFLALGGTPAKGRLKKSTRRTDDRCTHFISMESPADVDGEVARWLRSAYEQGNETKAKPKKDAKTPADLSAMLKKSPKAGATFDALTPRMKSEWIHWIEDAKQADTRARRIDRAAERLGKGLKGIY